MEPFGTIDEHLVELSTALDSVAAQAEEIEEWGRHLARCLDGGRLLVAGNGGSAAEAQHLTAELVGRFEGERRPLSALVLHGDTSTVTAVCTVGPGTCCCCSRPAAAAATSCGRPIEPTRVD